ncbi:MAG TPA: hypothetical protein VGR37_07140 [Longimicrobiaceae bacterium]|nr:hypothetical protein [Longimicrobiaceae bacterium]
MYTTLRSGRAAALLMLLPLFAVGCSSRTATVATAAGGAAAAVALSDQNAEGEAHGTLAELDRRTRAVFASMGLQITKSSTETSGSEREYEARSGDRVVHVKLEQPAGSHMTKVSVSSRRGTTLDYDVSHARTVLARIQQQS